MTNEDFSFRKQERIVSQKLIDELFSGTGSLSLAAFPVRIVYLLRERRLQDATPAQILISVSKRRFKLAVDRNRVKRQIREAYRKHKQEVLACIPEGKMLNIAVLWMSDKHYSTAEVEKRLTGLLQRMSTAIKTSTSNPQT